MRAVGNDVVKKTYIYANSQIIAQHDGDTDAEIYYYLHDRLGSVRQIIDNDANVVNRYTYRPFGKMFIGGEREEGITDNRFRFAGQWLDDEIQQYYMRARQYDTNINRFTSRDPVAGKSKEPMTLHVYLYCINDPVNGIDPSGEFIFHLADAIITGSAFYGHTINLAAYGAASGDLRFFDLAAGTGKFMTAGWAIALVEPLGVWDRIFTYVLETSYESYTGGITGFTWEEALSVDVIAFAAYYSYMLHVENKLDINVDDMQDFIDWKREFWQ